MFALTLVAFATISKARFHGATVELRWDHDTRTFELRSTFKGATERWAIEDNFDNEHGEFDYGGTDESKLAVEPIGVGGERYLVSLTGIHPNSGGTAGSAHILAIGPKGLQEIGRIQSNQMFTFVSLDHGGKAIASSYEIGDQMAHSEMPRWQNFYEVRDGLVVQITHSPMLYGPWVRRLHELLLQHPSDLSLWAHYGLALKYSGSPTSPRTAYRRILKEEPHWQLHEGTETEAVKWLNHQIATGHWPKDYHPVYWLELQPLRREDRQSRAGLKFRSRNSARSFDPECMSSHRQPKTPTLQSS